MVQVMQMRKSVLLPILRSQTQGELLAWLYLHPEDEFTVGELAAQTASDISTVSREASRFVEADFLKERRQGKLRFLRANTDSIIAEPLTRLLTATYGPVAVIGEALASVDGIEKAFIYGSWAARYHGESGPIPNDVDVLVIGNADDDELFEIARRCESQLGREVNVHQTTTGHWKKAAEDKFLRTVQSRPMVQVVGETSTVV